MNSFPTVPLSTLDQRIKKGDRQKVTSTVIPTWKRAMDISMILVCLPLILPVVLFISILIKLTSRGPVLFSQERVGLGGTTFTLYKFRTMKVGADAKVHEGHLKILFDSNAPLKKADLKDKRLIPPGLILRSTGLDEIPQIINILRGDMSLVGPRPCMPYEAREYAAWQMERFDVLPGVTGLWQVSGKNKTTHEQMMRFDIQYARTLSFWRDLTILLRTPAVLVVQVVEIIREKLSDQIVTKTSCVRERMGKPKSIQVDVPFVQSQFRAPHRMPGVHPVTRHELPMAVNQ